MTAAGESAGRAPAAVTRSASGAYPTTSCPAVTRQRVMRPPMLPNPMNPTRSAINEPPRASARPRYRVTVIQTKRRGE